MAETVCQTCGDKGELRLLICCVKCQDSTVHYYCLDKFSPDDEDITWMCEECAPKVIKSSPSRKSERISLRKDEAVEERMNWKNKLKKEGSSLPGNIMVSMEDRLEETPQSTSDYSLPCEEMKDLHSVDETFGNQVFRKDEAVEDRMNWKNKLKKEGSSLPGNIMVSMEDRLEETPQSTSDYSLPCEEMKDLHSVDETFGNQVFRKRRRRLLLDGDSPEEDYDSVNAEATLLASYGHCGPSKLLYSQPYLDSDNSVHFENQELWKQKRIFLLKDRDSPEEELESVIAEASYGHYGPLNVLCTQPSCESDNYVHAQPVIDPIWRGSFNITNEKKKIHVGLVAHLSSKACYKVSDAATLLPQELDVEILPRSDAWPKSFQTSPPTDDNIALYIFPKFQRDEKVFDDLLYEIIEHNHALKAVINDVELLVFSSLELPQEHWRFRRKYYMWGVFRPNKQSSPAPLPTRHAAVRTSSSDSTLLPQAKTSSSDSLSSCSSKLNRRLHKTKQACDGPWDLKMQHRKGENMERIEAI